MARPTKPRRIRHWPIVSEFRPNKRIKKSTITLGLDEWEAIYLKDIGKLSQDEVAKMMDVSRQTVQMILESAHHKMALAHTQGYKLEIRGGVVFMHYCHFLCNDCYTDFEIAATNPQMSCPECGSANTVCTKGKYCRHFCQRQAQEA